MQNSPWLSRCNFYIFEILLLLMVSTLVHADGIITGTIIDSVSGAAIPGAQITLEGTPKVVESDRSGQFRLLSAPSGNQTLVVTRQEVIPTG